MRTKDRYRFELKAEWIESGEELKDTKDVNPILSKMEVKYSRPSDEMYYEKAFDSDFRLIGSDFDWVMDKGVSTRFTLIVMSKQHNLEIARCNFRKSDCDVDVNHREVHIRPKADNPYELLKGKLDEEIDIKPLRPRMSEISFMARPSLQVYVLGSSYLTTTSYSGTSQQVITNPVTSEATMIANRFYKSPSMFYARVTSDGDMLSGDISNFTNGYTLSGNRTPVSLQLDESAAGYVKYSLYIDGVLMSTQEPRSTLWDNVHNITNYNLTFTFTYLGRQTTVWVSDLTCRYVYGRLVYRSANGSNLLPEGSAFPIGSYHSGVGVILGGSSMIMSSAKTSSVTEYGRYNANQYYTKPNVQNIEPIGQDMWMGAPSLWCNTLSVLDGYNGQYQSQVELRDWYSFGSALKAVLQKLDDRIDFEETEEYSKFLFAEDNPVLSTSGLRFRQGRLYMLQKSNLLSLDYDVSSNNNKITLRKMLQFLKYALNCYWNFQSYIAGNGDTRYKFNVEHVYYYMNGGAYSASEDGRAVIDLTMMKDAANGVLLSKNTNRWSYNVGSGNGTATKIQYHWMDKESPAFDGYDMDVPEESRILSDDTLEERTIDWFSSDIDYLLANADECSKDGFLVVWTGSNSNNEVPIDSTPNSVTLNMQNYRLAIAWLQQHILLYNIGSKYVKINNKSLNNAIRGVKPMRKANVKFMPIIEVTPDCKVKTEAGEGVIDSMTIDMTCGLVSADLLYELED